MKSCMFCDREHDRLYGDKIKYCEHCKQDEDALRADAEVERIIRERKNELKFNHSV